MNDTEIVHKFKLADQEGYQKKLFVYGTCELFYIAKIGKPCGETAIFETKSVDELLNFVRTY